ncbi:MAG: S8 family serine peptidase, partial [Candidatus Hodarchaeota archaeon]
MGDTMEPRPRRGTTILVLTIILVSVFTVAVVLPPALKTPDLRVRVAIIDSGITRDESLRTRLVAEKCFICTDLGYSLTINTTEDSMPEGALHGTYVAKVISVESPNAAILNAKVVTENNTATIEAIVSAITWAVLNESCNVINLSLGARTGQSDLLREVIVWAFNQGVSVIASAGNHGYGGIPGTSIETPADYPEVIAVAAVDDSRAPYYFSARGPLRNRISKPDISAVGYYSTNGVTVFGTSFAAPRVTSAVVSIIEYCQENGLSWTPGMIKAAIINSASYIPLESWEVGAGLLDAESAIDYIANSQVEDRLPLIATVTPQTGPYEFERWFVNTSIDMVLSIFCSNYSQFIISYSVSQNVTISGPEE